MTRNGGPDGAMLEIPAGRATPENDDDQVLHGGPEGGEARRDRPASVGVSGYRWSPDGRRWCSMHAPSQRLKKDADG